MTEGSRTERLATEQYLRRVPACRRGSGSRSRPGSRWPGPDGGFALADPAHRPRHQRGNCGGGQRVHAHHLPRLGRRKGISEDFARIFRNGVNAARENDACEDADRRGRQHAALSNQADAQQRGLISMVELPPDKQRQGKACKPDEIKSINIRIRWGRWLRLAYTA
jgi:hypothetical protein